jgi:hypothetical protein
MRMSGVISHLSLTPRLITQGPSMRACALSPLAFPELWQPPSAQRIVDVVSPVLRRQ